MGSVVAMLSSTRGEEEEELVGAAIKKKRIKFGLLDLEHLAIDYHFVRDLVAGKELTVFHVPTSHQLADLLAKPLSHFRHAFLLDKIGVRSPTTILRGRIGISVSCQLTHYCCNHILFSSNLVTIE